MRDHRRCAFVIGFVVAGAAVVGVPLAQAQSAASPPAAGQAKTDDRDRKAKRLFVSGNYREAIEVLTDLYSETGNPVYLRNIARCHQRLRDPDRAIASFEEYLLRAKDITAKEREEVKGFIREQEELKRKSGGDSAAAGRIAAPAPVPATPPAPAPTPPAAGPPPAATASPPPFRPGPPAGAPSTMAAATPSAPPPAAFAPPPAADPALAGTVTAPGQAPAGGGWKRTAGVVGMVAAGALAAGAGVALTTAWISHNRGQDNGCGTVMTCESRAKGIESRNTLTAILAAGAGVTGAVGLTLFLLSPPPAPRADAAIPTGLTVGLRGAF
jgi:hypothetical protein